MPCLPPVIIITIQSYEINRSETLVGPLMLMFNVVTVDPHGFTFSCGSVGFLYILTVACGPPPHDIQKTYYRLEASRRQGPRDPHEH